jgi:hypothetical protein
MTNFGLTAIASAIALGIASGASAGVTGPVADGGGPEENAEPGPEMESAPPETWTPARDVGVAPAPRWTPSTGIGISVMAGGGVTDFTGNVARDSTGTGGSWDVRVAIATRRWVGGELSYVGGVGWNAYRVANFNTVTADTSINPNSSDTLTVPAGIGFAAGYKGFIADIRGTYRATFLQGIFPSQSGTALSNWDFGGMLGYEF